MDTPSIFMPMTLRTGTKYKALSHHCFSVPEKQWLCLHITHKKSLSDVSIRDIITEISTRHDIDSEHVMEWYRVIASGMMFSVLFLPSDQHSFLSLRPLIVIVSTFKRSSDSELHQYSVNFTVRALVSITSIVVVSIYLFSLFQWC